MRQTPEQGPLILSAYGQDFFDVARQSHESALLSEDVDVSHGTLDHGSGVHLHDGGVTAHTNGELMLMAQAHGFLGRRKLDQDLLEVMLR